MKLAFMVLLAITSTMAQPLTTSKEPKNTLADYRISSSYPTANEAFKAFQILDAGVCRGLGLPYWARSLVNQINPFIPSSYDNSYRFNFTFNAPEFYIYNMECVVIQYTITWKCPISQEQQVNIPMDSLGTIYKTFTYTKQSDTLIYRDRVFTFYVKSVEGWLYHGTFSNLDGMAKLVQSNSILPGYSPGFGRARLDKPAWEIK